MNFTVHGQLPRKSNRRRIVRNRATNHPMIIKSDEALQYEKDFEMQVPKKYKLNLTGDIDLTAVIYYQSRRSDLSDELLCDCLEKAGVIKNDRQIMHKDLTKKLDKTNPRVEIELSEWQH